MPRKSTITCAKCGKLIPTPESIKHNNKRYCKDCYETVVTDNEDMTVIRNFLYGVMDGDIELTKYVFNVVKKIKERNDWKFSGIALTIKYIQDNNIELPDLIEHPIYITNVIEYYYPIAKKEYIELKALKKEQESAGLEIKNNLKTVYIKQSELRKREALEEERRKLYLYGPKFDLDDLEDTGR